MSVDFHTIRPIRGSQQYGFEELCCQLAHTEDVPAGSRFIRNGTPDGGVEAFWILPGGAERCWQAKYFFSFGDSQLTQLDDSVRTAIARHPNLIEYTICLPIDLPDSRQGNQRSARQKWEDRTAKWKEWGIAAGRKIDFVLWGEHELLSRLAEPKHAGKRWFWFRHTEFSPEWLHAHVMEQVRYAGPRYTQELRVDLPIAQVFESLGYTTVFRRILRKCLKEVINAWERFHEGLGTRETSRLADGTLDLLGQNVACFRESLSALELEYPPSNWHIPISTSLRDASNAVWKCYELLNTLPSPDPAPDAVTPNTSPAFPTPKNYDFYRLNNLRDALSELRERLDGFYSQLVDTPFLLVAGEAGTGKTHLLCDVAVQRTNEHLPTLLLMGQQFGSQSPWPHLIQRLGLDCTRDELLGALDSAAEAAGGRALIFVDAINEAVDVAWRDELPAMMEVLARFPRVGFAVTCRSTYERHEIRGDLVPARLTRIEHQGFASRLNEALAAFFAYYDIEGFNTPPLAPEFENPLFLKLVCEGLHRRGLRRPPRGFFGLTRVFCFLIDSVNERLAGPDQLDFISQERVVHTAVDHIANEMARTGTKSVPLSDARQFLQRLLPRGGGHSDSLLGKLMSEGLLTQDLLYGRKGKEPVPVVRFTYERFADHQIARRLLDEHLDVDAQEASFTKGTVLGDLIRSNHAAGLLTALCIQIPERTGRQLFDIVPDCFVDTSASGAFVASLPWLEPRCVDASVIAQVERMLSDSASWYFGELVDALLGIAAEPDHPLNARWLHQYLRGLPMAERDASWSIFLHHQYDRGRSVDRWLEWAWPLDCEVRDPASLLDDETLVLCGLTLGWFLTTSNRFVRDRATKALVSLFYRHVQVYGEVIRQFDGVDDYYVAERLYAVAYGSVMRSDDRTAIAALADQVYRQVFGTGHPPAHILLRHYARGVVEYALHLGCDLNLDSAKIRPPYQSSWPLTDPPPWNELRKQYDASGYARLILSLWPDNGDFARYVLGTDSPSGVHAWTDQQSPPETEDEEMEPGDATEEYPPELQAKLGQLLESIGTQFRVASPDDANEDDHDAGGSESLMESFLSSLSEDERIIVEKRLVGRSSHECWLEWKEQAYLESDFAPRWILLRVLELGWTPERFATFDDNVGYGDTRAARKPERIAKKYQWIALHEFLAHVLDHRPYRHDYHGGTMCYDGPWQTFFSDIDPSLLVRGSADDDHTLPVWWAPVSTPLEARTQHMDDTAWLEDNDAIPDPTPMLVVRRPSDSSAWYSTEGGLVWKETDDSLEQRKAADPRRVSFSFASFLVRVQDLEPVVQWMNSAELSGLDTDVPKLFSQYLGEYGWAASHEYLRQDAKTQLGSPVADSSQVRLFDHAPAAIAHTTMRFLDEEGFDCSLDKTVSGHVPSLWVAERMDVSWGRCRFRFVDKASTVVAFDPSHEETGPSGLLIRKDHLDRFLAGSGLTLLWHVVGEKLVLSENPHRADWPGRFVFRRTYYVRGGTIHGSQWSTVRM